MAKTEVLNWDNTVYSTTVNGYNGLDQVTSMRQYQGSEQSGVYQDTTMGYDGYGRLQTQHLPGQNSGTATVFSYNLDDTVYSITDARGATSTYDYNGRHQVTSATHVLGQSTIYLGYGYDAAGNRTSVSDSQGSTSYTYDQLSRVSSEIHAINGVGSYTISYNYNLANELTSVTDPFGAQVGYNHDNSGRVSSITGSGFANVSTYASNIQYRAWGGVKHLNYGNTLTLDAGYNARLQPTSFIIPNVINKTYQYNNDGSPSYSHELIDQRFDRAYSYDQTAKITQALSGAEARGEGTTNDRPYKQSYGYDAFGHLNMQNTNHWTTFASSTDSYSNNRHAGWSYDADGRLLTNNQQTYTYDAAGNMATAQSETTTTQSFDGDGRPVKTVETVGTTSKTTYYVRSKVLGGKVLTELTSAGAKQRTFVYSGNQVLAWQESPFGSPRVMWEHRDPTNASFRMTDVNGSLNTGTDQEQPAELDPLGADSGTSNPYLIDPNPPDENTSMMPYPSFGDPRHPGTTYSFNGIRIPADYFFMLSESLRTGGVENDPNNASSATTSNLGPKLPIFGVFCTQVISNGIIQTECTTEITGYTGEGVMAGGVNPQKASFIAQKIRADIGAAQARLKGDQGCRDFLNQLLASVEPKAGMIDGQKLDSAGHWVRNDIFDALDEMSHGSFEETSKSGVTKDSSLETINDLSTPVGSRHVLVNNSYVTQSDEVRMFAVIHESLHMFAGFTDQALASAARQIVGDKAKLYSGDPAGTKQASEDLNYYIQRKCPGLKADKGTTYRIGE